MIHQVCQGLQLSLLDLQNNDLAALPAELGLMTSLRSLQLDGNGLRTIRRPLITGVCFTLQVIAQNSSSHACFRSAWLHRYRVLYFCACECASSSWASAVLLQQRWCAKPCGHYLFHVRSALHSVIWMGEAFKAFMLITSINLESGDWMHCACPPLQRNTQAQSQHCSSI
jgi:Leucine-rich repeat (LRR) protein